MPNPQAVQMMQQQGQITQLPNASTHGQGFAPNTTVPVQSYSQGVPPTQPQPPQPPLTSTSISDRVTLPDGPNSQDTSNSSGQSQGSSGQTKGNSTPVVTPSKVNHRKRSEDVRTYVLGPLEEQFDTLMDQVRDADPTTVLKKVH